MRPQVGVGEGWQRLSRQISHAEAIDLESRGYQVDETLTFWRTPGTSPFEPGNFQPAYVDVSQPT